MVEETGILVREAVVVLLPDVGGEQIVQRGDLPPPGQFQGDLQPLGVLAEHRVDDANECLIAVEEPVPPGQQISFQPALALVLAEHRVQHATGGREEFVILYFAGLPLTVGDFKDRAQEIRERLIGTEDAEITLILIQRGHVAEEVTQHEGILSFHGAGRRHTHRMGVEIRHAQVAEENSAVGVRISAHPPVALGRQFGQFRQEPAVVIEQLFRLVAFHPAFQQLDMIGMLGIDQERHLVRTEGALDLQAVDDFRSRPALGRPEDDHGPARPSEVVLAPRIALNLPDVLDGLIQSAGHELMHLFRIVAFHEVGRPAAAPQELLQFLMLDAGQDGRVADLVAIEVQDRQHGSVVDWVEKLVGLPCGRQGTRFRLAVADDAGDDQIGIVERRPEGMAERIAQLAAFVNRPRRRRGDMAGNPAGERELLEQLFQPGFVLGDVRINVAPGAFEVNIAHNRRAAVTGTGDVEHVQVILLDDPVQVYVDEVLARRGAPMPDHQGLDVRQFQRLLQQRIVVEINLADREVVRGTPIGVHLSQQIGRQRFARFPSSPLPRRYSP